MATANAAQPPRLRRQNGRVSRGEDREDTEVTGEIWGEERVEHDHSSHGTGDSSIPCGWRVAVDAMLDHRQPTMPMSPMTIQQTRTMLRFPIIRLAAIGLLLATNTSLAQTDSIQLLRRHLPADVYRVPVATSERDEVERAVRDYLEGFYEGDTVKLMRSVWPSVFKYGFWKPKDSTAYAPEQMPYAEVLDYARKFRAAKRTTPPDAPREVTIYEVQNQTASAKVRAWWGTDYVLLGKVRGKWMVMEVLLQGP